MGQIRPQLADFIHPSPPTLPIHSSISQPSPRNNTQARCALTNSTFAPITQSCLRCRKQSCHRVKTSQCVRTTMLNTSNDEGDKITFDLHKQHLPFSDMSASQHAYSVNVATPCKKYVKRIVYKQTRNDQNDTSAFSHCSNCIYKLESGQDHFKFKFKALNRVGCLQASTGGSHKEKI